MRVTYHVSSSNSYPGIRRINDLKISFAQKTHFELKLHEYEYLLVKLCEKRMNVESSAWEAKS